MNRRSRLSLRHPIPRSTSLVVACAFVVVLGGIGLVDGLYGMGVGPIVCVLASVGIGALVPTTPCLIGVPVAVVTYAACYAGVRELVAPFEYLPGAVAAGAFAGSMLCLVFACLASIISLKHWPWRPLDANECDVCGYCLVGLTESRCPECFTPFKVV